MRMIKLIYPVQISNFKVKNTSQIFFPVVIKADFFGKIIPCIIIDKGKGWADQWDYNY